MDGLGRLVQASVGMSPVEGPHLHQALNDRIIPHVLETSNPHLFTDPDHVPPQDIVIGKSGQDLIVLSALFKMLGPSDDHAMTHPLGNLASSG